jgi:hypothetical protein
MCQVDNMLWQAGALNDTPDLDGAFLLDEFSNGIKQ